MAQELLELHYNSASKIYDSGTTALPAGVYATLISWQVPLQAGWYIPQNPKLLMILKNSSGTQVPVNTMFTLSYQRPTDQLPTALGAAVLYAFYSTHDIAAQSSASYDSNVRMPLYTAKSFIQNTIISLLIKVPSTFTIDWTQSEVYIQSVTQVDANA